MRDMVEAFCDVSIEHVFRLLLDRVENGFDGVMG